MRITADISTNSPSLNGNISNDGINLNGNLSIGEFDPSNLKIRVTNLENNAVGTIDLSYDNQTSELTLTTKNIKNESIGTPQIVVISGGISSIDYDNTTKDLIITLSNGDELTVSLKDSFDELAAQIPTKLSQLTNDTGFITSLVDNLTNYYKKSETYTQTEINNLIAAIPKTKVEVVQTLPTASAIYWFDYSHTIYLAPKSTSQTSNVYDEYICMRSGTEGSYTYSWEKIGDTAIDLSNYVEKEITSEQTIEQYTITTYNNVDNQMSMTGLGSTLNRKFSLSDGTELGAWLAVNTLGIIMMHTGTASTPDAQSSTSSVNVEIDASYGVIISQLADNITKSIVFRNGNITADAFIKNGGTSSQFLKADGSVDSNTYATLSSLNGYVKLSAPQQTIETNQTGIDIPLIIKSGMAQATTLGFMNVNNALIGYLKVDNQDKVYFIDSSVNEHELAFKSNIPTNTSDLNNDSGFITNAVDNLSNYYNKTTTDSLLGGKQSSLSSSQLDAVNSGIDSTKVGQIATNTSNISTINEKIPSTASSSNKLTDEDFVNSSINALAAFFITRTAAGDNFNTYAQLSSATTFYSGGSARIPTTNDYTYVRWDETKGETVTGYTSFTTTADYIGHYVIYNNEGIEVDSSNKDSLGITPGTTIAYDNLPTTRYSYQGGTYPNGQWNFQLIVNNSGLTAAQMAAINSGITSSLVTQITTNQTNIANKMDKANPTGSGVLKLNANPDVLLFGDYSASIGYLNAATNRAAIALNYGTVAQHESSTTMGRETTTSAANQLVFGKYNSTTNLSNALEIVGNGTASNNRSNARTLDTSGNETLAGWLTMNGSVKAVGRNGSASQTTEQTLLDNYYTKSQVDAKGDALQTQITSIRKSWLFTGALKNDSATYVGDCIFDFELPYTGTYTINLLLNKNGSNGNGGIMIGIFNNYSDLTNGNYSGWFTAPTNGWKASWALESRNETINVNLSATAGEHLLIFAGNGNQVSTTKAFTLKLSV